MHCELLVPGLFAAPPEARLPALELLLARGRCTSSGSQTCEAWLHDAFELDTPLPAGALTLLGAAVDPGADWCLRADPVHLRLMQDRMVLAPAAALHLQRAEAEALCEALSHHFAPQWQVQPVDAGRWVARGAEAIAIEAQPPLELAGRDVMVAVPATASQLLN